MLENTEAKSEILPLANKKSLLHHAAKFGQVCGVTSLLHHASKFGQVCGVTSLLYARPSLKCAAPAVLSQFEVMRMTYFDRRAV